MRRYQIDIYIRNTGVIRAGIAPTLAEAKKIIIQALDSDTDNAGGYIYDHKTECVVAIYNDFNIDHIAEAHRGSPKYYQTPGYRKMLKDIMKEVMQKYA